MQKAVLNHAKYKWFGIFICALGAFFYCYEYILRIEPSVMVPQLMQSFQLNAQGIGWLVGMYYYAYTPMQAVVGISTDYWGPRKVLVGALSLCAIGALLFGFSQSVLVAAAGRLLMGMGSAFAFVCALKLASLWLHQKYFALFAGITTSLGMIGGMFGDIGMQHVVDRFDWQQVLIASSIVGFCLVPIYWFAIPDNSRFKSSQSTKPSSIKSLMEGFVDMFCTPQMWLSGLIGCMLYLSLSAFGEIWGIPYLQSIKGIDHDLAAKLNSLVFFGWLIGSPISGWLSDYLKSRRIPLLFGSLLAAACIAIVIFANVTDIRILAVLLFAFGFFCSNEILCFAVARESTPLNQAATAIGFTNMLIMLGGMVTQPLVGSMLDWVWQGTYVNGIRAYSAADFHHALIILPVAMVISAGFAWFLKETYSNE